MKKKHRELQSKVCNYLRFIYPDQDSERLCRELLAIMRLDEKCRKVKTYRNTWNQEDVVMITYGDSIVQPGEQPLQTLHDFLERFIDGYINTVHILPFYPWSSDDGFSVIDYKQVNEALGTWEDVEAIARDYKLMADLVINHCSSLSEWFE